MRIVAFVLCCLVLAGCITPKERTPLFQTNPCPPLPLLPEFPPPTAAQRQQWTDTVIVMYVNCAKRPTK